MRTGVALAFLVLAGLAGGSSRAETRVTPGELAVDPPTLINLGFEWAIAGDDNRNASVTVSYRKKGDAAWKVGMPLLRLQGERVFFRGFEKVFYGKEGIFDVVMPNMFAGSILDLTPDTQYEVRLTLSDPDGGKAVRTQVVKTRAEPTPAVGGRVFHVYPPDYKGPRQQPAFDALMCAYNNLCGSVDTVQASRPRVKPGDVILVHAGVYKYSRDYYTEDKRINASSPVEGAYYLTASGTPDRPIVIKAAGDGEVVFDGNGAFNLFNVKAANYNYFEGITFRNTEIAIWAGTQFQSGSSGLTVKHSRFEDVNVGIWTDWSGSRDFYIADNTFLGRDDPNHLIGWNGEFWKQFAGVEGQAFPPKMGSYSAVRLYGSGHVVAYNYVADFHDGIDVETYGNPDGTSAESGPQYPPRAYWDRRPVSIDIYNNYMTNFHDNAFEIDGSMHNVRVMRNMMLNSASHPMCNQPALGGPVYWIRNIVFHAPSGSTRMSYGAAGVVFYNNTILAETNAGSSANAHWRNNLMLGANAAAAVMAVSTNTNYSSSDYNGFRPNPGAADAFRWTSPPWKMRADYSDLLAAHQGFSIPLKVLDQRRYPTLAEYAAATQQDRHSILVDYDVFEHVPALEAQNPRTVQRLYRAEDLDFRLKAGSVAVDRGLAIPNVTDGYGGEAPDLGALERGTAAPHYGPRP